MGRAARAPVLALAAAGLVLGLGGGLLRLGLAVPAPAVAGAHHGVLMVCGFLGTLIAIERAVALRVGWAWAAPVLCGGGVLATLGGLAAGPHLAAAGAMVYLVASLVVAVRAPAGFTATLAAGALAFAASTAGWAAGMPVPSVVPGWIAFLVLTIAGERLELSRLRRPPAWSLVPFALAVLALLAGAGAGSWTVLGASMIVLAAWMLQFDVASRTVGIRGLPRFVAICLIAGQLWLVFAGVLAVVGPPGAAGPRYDAVLHAVFVGFAFSMIFGHAPVVLPAVLGLKVPFARSFYVHVALLHGSLVLRVTGDLVAAPGLRTAGGALGVVAIAWFAASTARAVTTGRRARGSPPPQGTRTSPSAPG